MKNTEKVTDDNAQENTEVLSKYGTLQLPGHGETTRGETANGKPAVQILMEASHALNVIGDEIDTESLSKDDLSVLRPKLTSLIPILSDNIEFGMDTNAINAMIFACEEFEEAILHIDSRFGRVDTDYIFDTVQRGKSLINEAIIHSLLPPDETAPETKAAYFSLVQFFKRQGMSDKKIEGGVRQLGPKHEHLIPELIAELNSSK